MLDCHWPRVPLDASHETGRKCENACHVPLNLSNPCQRPSSSGWTNCADIAAADNTGMLRSKGVLVLNELHHYRSVLEPSIFDRLVKVLNQILAHTFQVERNSFLPF